MKSRSIAFLHPDLGLGGAERLVVDAAVELAERGHQVDVYTAFHDPSRCFKETIDASFTVIVCGGWFPRNIMGKAHAFCAYIRCILVAIHIAWKAFRRKRQYDVVIADQVSAVIPMLHLLTSSQVLFYCHHPDMLLALRRPGLHRAYRVLLDWIEEVTTGQADRILVNSAYTAGVFKKTFTKLWQKQLDPGVLHPACQIPTDAELRAAQQGWQAMLPPGLAKFMFDKAVFLSINRFERKKDVGLAVRALAELLQLKQTCRSGHKVQDCRLVLAGGYDARLAENREYLHELKALTIKLGVQDQVQFLPSFSDQQKSALLAACTALLYTPVNEHFGIVPLEAMAAGKPVLACNSGGPKESVLHTHTGFLCEAQPASFAAAMRRLLASEEECKALGEKARSHVLQHFSRKAFGTKLEGDIEEMLANGKT